MICYGVLVFAARSFAGEQRTTPGSKVSASKIQAHLPCLHLSRGTARAPPQRFRPKWAVRRRDNQRRHMNCSRGQPMKNNRIPSCSRIKGGMHISRRFHHQSSHDALGERRVAPMVATSCVPDSKAHEEDQGLHGCLQWANLPLISLHV